MDSGLLGRIQGLARCDRLLLLVTIFWSMGGIPANYFHRYYRTDRTATVMFLMTLTLWATIAAALIWSLVRRQRRPADYGFSFKAGGMASLAVLGGVHIYLVTGGKLVLSSSEGYLWSAIGALMEEILFRAIAIDLFVTLMDGIKAKALWAILASSILWSLPHIPSKSPAQLFGGIFLGGLFFGYLYHKSRSILLPAWIHAGANAGYLGGMLIAGLYCLISFGDWRFGLLTQPAPPEISTPAKRG
jgi:membrane protease YdiL (CAAX protease family)